MSRDEHDMIVNRTIAARWEADETRAHRYSVSYVRGLSVGMVHTKVQTTLCSGEC